MDGDVFEGFSFEDSVEAEDWEREEEAEEETVEGAVFESAEIVAVLDHEVFEVNINWGIVNSVTGFAHECWLNVILVDYQIRRYECEEEAQDKREDEDFDETAFFEVLFGESGCCLPLFAENFIAVPNEANEGGHEGRDEDCNEIHNVSGLVMPKHKQKNRFLWGETVFHILRWVMLIQQILRRSSSW